MDNTKNGEEGDCLTDSKRQDVEELIALLGDYKLKIKKISQAKSEATLSEEDIALESFVKKMVLIKRKSLAEFSTDGCSNNRLDDADDSDTSNEDDGREREGLMSVLPSESTSETANSASCLNGGIKVSDVEELISLLNDFLDAESGADVVDFSPVRTSSKMVRRATAVEEILMEKRNSSHCVVPQACSGSVCKEDYMRDKLGICRKIITVARIIRNPKASAAKWK